MRTLAVAGTRNAISEVKKEAQKAIMSERHRVCCRLSALLERMGGASICGGDSFANEESMFVERRALVRIAFCVARTPSRVWSTSISFAVAVPEGKRSCSTRMT
eukprot:scaffold187257_cov35-Tisochrysis_lutea.AAC.3